MRPENLLKAYILLQIADFLLTTLFVYHLGVSIELNPILKNMTWFIIFKAIAIISFIIYYIFYKDQRQFRIVAVWLIWLYILCICSASVSLCLGLF